SPQVFGIFFEQSMDVLHAPPPSGKPATLGLIQTCSEGRPRPRESEDGSSTILIQPRSSRMPRAFRTSSLLLRPDQPLRWTSRTVKGLESESLILPASRIASVGSPSAAIW